MSTAPIIIQLPNKRETGFVDLSQEPQITRNKVVPIKIRSDVRVKISVVVFFDEDTSISLPETVTDENGHADITVEIASDTCQHALFQIYVEGYWGVSTSKYLVMAKVVD